MPNLPKKTSLSNLVVHLLLVDGLEYLGRLLGMKMTTKKLRKKKWMAETLVCTCAGLTSLFASNINRHYGRLHRIRGVR